MKLLIRFLLFIFIISLTNCTVLKKRYSKGYTIEWNKKYSKVNKPTENTPNTVVNEESNNVVESEIETTYSFKEESKRSEGNDNSSIVKSTRKIGEKTILDNSKAITEIEQTPLTDELKVPEKEDNIFSIIAVILSTSALILLILLITLQIGLSAIFIAGLVVFLAFILASVAKFQILNNKNKYSYFSISAANFITGLNFTLLIFGILALLITAIYLLISSFVFDFLAFFVVAYLIALLISIIISIILTVKKNKNKKTEKTD